MLQNSNAPGPDKLSPSTRSTLTDFLAAFGAGFASLTLVLALAASPAAHGACDPARDSLYLPSGYARAPAVSTATPRPLRSAMPTVLESMPTMEKKRTSSIAWRIYAQSLKEEKP